MQSGISTSQDKTSFLTTTPIEPHSSTPQLRDITRGLLVVWALAVWGLFILLPTATQLSNPISLSMHVPYVLIGLVLVGAVGAAYKLQSDAHLAWFLTVLLLLAGWM